MPAVPQGSLILVSGASGFIASWTVQQLLERGFSVRGTVRSESKGEYLKNLFHKHGDRFHYVVVEDVEKQDGFDEAVKGVQGIAHIASPFHFKVDDPYKDLIDPAVNGTLSMLKSAKKNGADVKRVVITSSFASIVTPKEPVYTFTEDDWNTESPKNVMSKGKAASPLDAYCASKVLAEKAAWDFVETEKPSFDLVTICPPWVLGPIIHQVSSAASVNTSVGAFYQFLTGEKTGDDAKGSAGDLVDVRDAAKAHIEALTRENAGGQRYAISKQVFSWQDALDALHSRPTAAQWPKLSQGTPGAGKYAKGNILDGSKSRKELGIEYLPFEDPINDMAASLKEWSQGW